MAETWFTPKEWKARLVEFAGRRLLRNVANGESTTYDVSRSEGQVSQEGDAFNTKNMNDLEQRVANGFADAKTAVDTLNRDLGGCSFEQDGVDFYIVGADAVRKKLTGNDIYEIAYNEGNGWAGKETIQLDVTNIPDYATLSLDSFKYVALLSSSGTGGATEEITGSYMGVKVLGYDSGSGKLSIQTANAYRPIFIVVIE